MKAMLFLFLVMGHLTMIKSQNVLTPDQMNPSKDYDNIHSEKLHSDSNGTSLMIWVKNSVKLHRHESHTEHIYVLEGSGDMVIGGDIYSIVPGDLIIIPQNTTHSLEVTSMEPVKVISFQSPEFLGKDRVFIEKERQKP